MKKITILFIALTTLTLGSCADKLVDSIFDCTSESVNSSVRFSADSKDPNTINFTASHNGEIYNLDNVTWDFGDGKTASGKDFSISHTYTTKGTYNVSATLTVAKKNNSDSTCGSTIEKVVEIK